MFAFCSLVVIISAILIDDNPFWLIFFQNMTDFVVRSIEPALINHSMANRTSSDIPPGVSQYHPAERTSDSQPAPVPGWTFFLSGLHCRMYVRTDEVRQMNEKDFLKAAIDEYFRTGNPMYQAEGRIVLVNLNTITRYKQLAGPVTYGEFEGTAICPE